MATILEQLGMPDRRGDDEYFRRLMQLGSGGGQPAPRARGRARAAPRRKKRRRKRKPKKAAQLATELFTEDLIIGSGEAAAPGIVPYALMPKEIRDQIPLAGPPVGWDPEKLSPQKRMLLEHLAAVGKLEREQASVAAVEGPPVPQ